MDKKTLISTIAITALVVALLGGGAVYWFNRPIYKVNKAIEQNDLETISDLYYKLKEEDKENVSHEMKLYCQGLSTSYLDGDIEYEVVKKQFDVLEDEVLADDSDFKEMYDSINLMHDSREAYIAGNAAFESGDYETALAQYDKVLGSHEDYDKVKANMEACRLALLPDFIGVWENTIDLGSLMAASMGMGGDKRFSFEMTSYYEFKEDGTGVKYTDTDTLKESFNGFIDLLLTIMAEQYEKQYGITKSQLDSAFKKQYGMSMGAYIKKNVDLDKTLSDLDADRQEFTYELDGEIIHATNSDGTAIDFHRDGDELLLYPDGHEDMLSVYKQYNIDIPLHFTMSK